MKCAIKNRVYFCLVDENKIRIALAIVILFEEV